jgi:hypothetical protein
MRERSSKKMAIFRSAAAEAIGVWIAAGHNQLHHRAWQASDKQGSP